MSASEAGGERGLSQSTGAFYRGSGGSVRVGSVPSPTYIRPLLTYIKCGAREAAAAMSSGQLRAADCGLMQPDQSVNAGTVWVWVCVGVGVGVGVRV